MPGNSEVITPLNRRHGKIQPHAVRIDHLSLGSELVERGLLDSGVLLSEVKATRGRSRVVLEEGSAPGHLKIVKVAASSKEISFTPSGGDRTIMRPGDVWFGVWNGMTWLTIHCSATLPQKPTDKVLQPESLPGRGPGEA